MTETKATGPSVKGSTEALLEAFASARKALAELLQRQDFTMQDKDVMNIESLRRENEALKKQLPELEKIIKEKL